MAIYWSPGAPLHWGNQRLSCGCGKSHTGSSNSICPDNHNYNTLTHQGSKVHDRPVPSYIHCTRSAWYLDSWDVYVKTTLLVQQIQGECHFTIADTPVVWAKNHGQRVGVCVHIHFNSKQSCTTHKPLAFPPLFNSSEYPTDQFMIPFSNTIL